MAFACASAQQKVPPKAAKTTVSVPLKLGVLSGRIFAITTGGDIKPARLAKIYLFYLRGLKIAEANEEDQNSAGMAWLTEEAKALKELNEALLKETREIMTMQRYSPWSESVVCLKELTAYQNAVIGTLTWGQESPTRSSQILYADADEEGAFKIPAQPGTYTLVASGRAGFNEAFWEAEVTVEPGTETTVKLPSPKKACFVAQQRDAALVEGPPRGIRKLTLVKPSR
jgi:hypothetical protein